MAELILSMSMSIDGFVSGPKGDIKWVFGGDQEAIAWKLDTACNASLHIMGSRTFRTMAAFWPTAATAFASPMNQIPKAVFSKQGAAVLDPEAGGTGPGEAPAGAEVVPSPTLQEGAASWGEAYVAGGDLAQEVARLKTQHGKMIVAHGGAAFARSLIAHGLVDRYNLLVHPIALGEGARLFCDLTAPRILRLVSSKAFPGGSMGQIYRPG